MDYLVLRNLLIRHEGMKLKPYRDTMGKLTIGVGRNLDERGITEAEAIEMLFNDIHICVREAENTFPWFKEIDGYRKIVVISMIFNMGMPRFKQFKKLIAAIEARDFRQAFLEMLDSVWAEQVGYRSEELAKMMRDGNGAGIS